MSCDGDTSLLATMSMPTFALYDDLRQELAQDTELRARRDAVVAGNHDGDWSVRDGLIIYDGRVFVPPTSAVLPDILQLAHTAGHEGVQKTLQRLHTTFYLDHDHRTVSDFIRACSTCQWNKTEALHPAGLLQPLPVPSRVWADIVMDFVEALPKVHGKSVLLTVVDRFSKFAHFIPLALVHGNVSGSRVLPRDRPSTWVS